MFNVYILSLSIYNYYHHTLPSFGAFFLFIFVFSDALGIPIIWGFFIPPPHPS